jgi:hypothetical protein
MQGSEALREHIEEISERSFGKHLQHRIHVGIHQQLNCTGVGTSGGDIRTKRKWEWRFSMRTKNHSGVSLGALNLQSECGHAFDGKTAVIAFGFKPLHLLW